MENELFAFNGQKVELGRMIPGTWNQSNELTLIFTL